MISSSSAALSPSPRLSGVSSRVRVSLRAGALAFAGIVAAGFFAGCGTTTGDYTYVTTIATGERMKFPLIYGRPALATLGTVTVREIGLDRTDKKDAKEVIYYFAFEDKSGAVPKAVRVEDVTDKTILALVEDLKPELTMNHWKGISKPLTADDPSLHWISYLDDMVRVFRFTITGADGREQVLYQAWMVPGAVKAAVRVALGQKA